MFETAESSTPAEGPAGDAGPAAIAEACAAHRAALADFVARARAVASAAWHAPRAPGKWTPAQEAAHLTLACVLFAVAVRGGAAAPRVPLERALRLQAAVLPGILAGRGFPAGVEAPPETVPPEHPGAAADVLSTLVEAAAQFERAAAEAHAAPERRAMHPYLGPMRPADLLLLSAAHMRHHATHLPAGTGVPAA